MAAPSRSLHLAAFGLGLCGALVGSVMAYAAAGDDSEIEMLLDLDTRFVSNDNLRLDPNSAGTSTFWQNRFGFGLLTENALSRLELGADGVFRVGDSPGPSDINGLDEPELSLLYSRAVADGNVEFDARYSRRDLQFLDAFGADEISDDTFTLNTGTREIWETGVSFETGQTATLGFAFSADYRERNFSDTTDPDLFDTENFDYTTEAILRFSPRTEGILGYTQEDYDASDAQGTERTTREISFAVTHEATPLMLLEASIGTAEIDESFSAPGVIDDDESGLIGSFGITRELPRGSVGLSLESEIENTGRRTRLEVERTFVMPRATLTLSGGIADSENGDIEPISRLDYAYQMPTGVLDVTLSQSVNTTEDGEDILQLRAGIGYVHDVNAISSVSTRLDFVSISDAGGGGGGVGPGAVQDEQRGTFSVTYTRGLTPDWFLDVGYQYNFEDTESTSSANSNQVFVGLNRSFRILP